MLQARAALPSHFYGAVVAMGAATHWQILTTEYKDQSETDKAYVVPMREVLTNIPKHDEASVEWVQTALDSYAEWAGQLRPGALHPLNGVLLAWVREFVAEQTSIEVTEGNKAFVRSVSQLADRVVETLGVRAAGPDKKLINITVDLQNAFKVQDQQDNVVALMDLATRFAGQVDQLSSFKTALDACVNIAFKEGDIKLLEEARSVVLRSLNGLVEAEASTVEQFEQLMGILEAMHKMVWPLSKSIIDIEAPRAVYAVGSALLMVAQKHGSVPLTAQLGQLTALADEMKRHLDGWNSTTWKQELLNAQESEMMKKDPMVQGFWVIRGAELFEAKALKLQTDLDNLVTLVFGKQKEEIVGAVNNLNKINQGGKKEGESYKEGCDVPNTDFEGQLEHFKTTLAVNWAAVGNRTGRDFVTQACNYCYYLTIATTANRNQT